MGRGARAGQVAAPARAAVLLEAMGRARRRMLLRLGADPRAVHLASRSRKGCWRMSTNSIVQAALTNEWLDQQGMPDLPGALDRLSLPPAAMAEPEAPVTAAQG